MAPKGQVRPKKVVSGGQTGVDRAALDAAMVVGLPTGGWCPRGRRAEDGVIPQEYLLDETPSEEYRQRTSWNVRDSDATLIVSQTPLVGGTDFTVQEARRLGKPYLVVSPWEADVEMTGGWLEEAAVRVLNVAGPRESTAPDVYGQARTFLEELFGSW